MMVVSGMNGSGLRQRALLVAFVGVTFSTTMVGVTFGVEVVVEGNDQDYSDSCTLHTLMDDSAFYW